MARQSFAKPSLVGSVRRSWPSHGQPIVPDDPVAWVQWYHAGMRQHGWLLCAACAAPAWLLGCPKADQPAPHASAARIASVAPHAATPPTASTNTPRDTPPAPATVPIEPTWRGDSCEKDADCSFDDPCLPRRCSALPARPNTACDESAPPPGACSCVENMCTLRPTHLASGDTSGAPACLREEDCAVDVATGTCHANGKSLIGPIFREGPFCTCKPSMGQCSMQWVEPVPCESWRDCSWVRQPRLRPVPASQVPRPVKDQVKPCKTGEIDSVCEAQGNRKVCRIVGWSC